MEPSIWFLRVTILELNEYTDTRKKNKGVNCNSFDLKRLKIYFPELNSEINKKTYCIQLISELCDVAYKNNFHLITPFG